MAAIEIQTLERFTLNEFRRIVTGYTTLQTYVVGKVETDERTVISLELHDLDSPLVRQYDHARTRLSYYRQVVRDRHSVGAYDGRRLVGLAIAERQDWNSTLNVWEFHVAESHRRRGIGRRMMDALVTVASHDYLQVISVETQNTNVSAIHFYRKVGFTLESIDLSYYGRDALMRGEVAVFMKRYL